jgi:hypothetical protein
MSLTATNAQVYKGTAAVSYRGAPTSNTALSLPGTAGNYMTLGSYSPAHFDTRSSALFAEAWIYPLAANGSVNQQVMAVTDASSTDWNMYIGTDNVIHFGYWAPSYTQVTTGAITFGRWNHVAISWNPSTRAMYVFLNGVASGPTTAGTTGVYTATREFRIGSETTGSVFNGYIQDVRVVQGGTVPTTSFTPAAAPFGLSSPTYVANMGTTVLSLASQYFQTNMRVTTGGTIQMYSRPILPPVLVNPGNNSSLVLGQTITVSQTALQPVNGITWSFSPTGAGLAVTSSTDYALTLTVNSSTILPTRYTVSATNKNGYTTVIQFTDSTPQIFGLFASPTASGTWNGISYNITGAQSGLANQQLFGTSSATTIVWDQGGAYNYPAGTPNGNFGTTLPGTSTTGDYVMVALGSAVTFSTVAIGLYGTQNYNPIGNIAVYGSASTTGPWTTLLSTASGQTNTNYNTIANQFVSFTFTTTGSYAVYAFQITSVLSGFGNNARTGCLYWS